MSCRIHVMLVLVCVACTQPVSQHPVFSLDLMMLVAEQGRERTLGEMEALLTQCGFQPRHVTLPAAPLGIVEGTAV